MAITTAHNTEYSDLDFLFKSNPNTGDLGTKKEINSVKQSVLNIIKTNHGEKVFQPLFGANLRQYLFENMTDIVAHAIFDSIKDAILNFEPRVKVLNIKIKDLADQNRIKITLEAQMISTSESFNIETSIERLR
jgi:phage baseplate assembly protein W